MDWWNAAFLLGFLILLVAGWWMDPHQRAQRAERARARAAERNRAREVDNTRQLDLDALYRRYRLTVRLYHAGQDPNLAGPIRLPSEQQQPRTPRG